MLDTFFLSFRLRNTYRVNTILHSLRSLPLGNKLLPDKLYASRFLLTLANTLSGGAEFFSVFLGKALYLGALYLLAAKVYGNSGVFLHLAVLLAITGGVTNTTLMEPRRDKYYAVILMRMEARSYLLTDFGYSLVKTLVGFLPFSLLFGHLAGLSAPMCLIFPIYVCGVKLCAGALYLRAYTRRGGALPGEDKRFLAKRNGFVLVTLLLAAIPPAFSLLLPPMAAAGLFALAIAAGAVAARRIVRFPAYRSLCKQLLTPELFALGGDAAARLAQENLQKKILTDSSITSSKTGYAFFNELFMRRHARILTRSAKRIAVILAAVVVGLAAATVLAPPVRQVVSELLLRSLPTFLWIMYFLNRGQQITHAMFMNCDHSMLTYRFYRQKSDILTLFRHRLWDVVRINLLPAAVLAVGLPLLLALSGGTEHPLNYAVLFISILAMSVFFSVHAMVLYYLLQPYNLELESKNPVYSIANAVTYAVCYLFIRAELPTLIFGLCAVVFCGVYVALALLLAYRLAPKTFHLR